MTGLRLGPAKLHSVTDGKLVLDRRLRRPRRWGGRAARGVSDGTRAALGAALVLAAGAGVAVGFALGQWDEAVGGGIGGARLHGGATGLRQRCGVEAHGSAPRSSSRSQQSCSRPSRGFRSRVIWRRRSFPLSRSASVAAPVSGMPVCVPLPRTKKPILIVIDGLTPSMFERRSATAARLRFRFLRSRGPTRVRSRRFLR